MMKRAFLLLFSGLACGFSFGQNSISLRMNLEKNRVYGLRSVSEQTVVQTINGNQQTVETASDYTISLKMLETTPAFIVTEVRIDSLSTRTNTMGKPEKMSSAGPANLQSDKSSEVVSHFMNKMTKNPLFAKIDFTGKTSEIVNSKMVSDMILKDTSAITLSEPLGSTIKMQVVNMVSDNAYKTLIDMFTFCLPGKTVSTGESWSYTSSANTGGMMLDISTTYKLDGIEGNRAKVSAESNIRAAANAVPMEAGGARVTYDDLKGLSKAVIIIDSGTGLVIENSAKTRLAGILGVSVAGMNMQIPLEVDGNSKVTSIK